MSDSLPANLHFLEQNVAMSPCMGPKSCLVMFGGLHAKLCLSKSYYVLLGHFSILCFHAKLYGVEGLNVKVLQVSFSAHSRCAACTSFCSGQRCDVICAYWQHWLFAYCRSDLAVADVTHQPELD